MKVKLAGVLARAVKTLQSRTPTPRLDSELLLSYVLKIERVQLYQIDLIEWTVKQKALFEKLIKARIKGQPVAQLVGTKDFMGLTLTVDSHVLIPRPETEQIALAAIEMIKKYSTLPIYDIGTGSGAIAVAIAYLTGHRVTASDISTRALTVAKKNATQFKVSGKIKLIRSSLGKHITKSGIVIANLPYLPNALRADKKLAFEPAQALFAGEDGLDLYRQLFKKLRFRVAIVEMGPNQYEDLKSYLVALKTTFQISPLHNLDGTICGLIVLNDAA